MFVTDSGESNSADVYSLDVCGYSKVYLPSETCKPWSIETNHIKRLYKPEV